MQCTIYFYVFIYEPNQSFIKILLDDTNLFLLCVFILGYLDIRITRYLDIEILRLSI